jgi:general secretion pathway protein K
VRRDSRRPPTTGDERGFALIAVLLVLAVLGIVGAEFAYSMRLEASSMRAWRDSIGAAHLAEAGVEQAMREIAAAGDGSYVTMADDGLLTFYDKNLAAFPRLARTGVRLGPGEFSYRITDEQARLNLNNPQGDRLDKLLQCMGVDKLARDQIVDAILDWIDPNEEHRTNGAESEDYYLKLPTPYRARNAAIESLNELLQIKGITPALFRGADGKIGLVDVLTVRAPGQVNVNTASPPVFCAMGVSDAQISEFVQTRRDHPYTSTSGRPGGTGLAYTTTTFRIESEGIIDGRTRARVTAIVQKRPAGQGASMTILEWSGVR